jgi:hypothetical protein
MSVGQLGSSATLTMGAAWKVMGARGRQAGLDDSVADLRMDVSRPDSASTLPAGTLDRRSRDLRGRGGGVQRGDEQEAG